MIEELIKIPEGWRIYNIDMSVEGRVNVLLKPPAGSGEEWVSAARPSLAEAIEVTSAIAQSRYRGWTIHQGRWPEPAWMATGPNYDASYEGEEDGWVDNGEKADAPTRDALIAEIDAWFEEHGDDS